MSEGQSPGKDYHVVLQIREGFISAGVKMQMAFEDKAEFDDWYNGTIGGRAVSGAYAVIAEGITSDQAQDIVDAPENKLATERAHEKEISALRAALSDAEEQSSFTHGEPGKGPGMDYGPF